jgi:hypothetical protein
MKIDQLGKSDMKQSSKNNDIEEQIEEERKEEEIRAFKTTLETTPDPNTIGITTSGSLLLSTEDYKAPPVQSIVKMYNNQEHYSTKHRRLRKPLLRLSKFKKKCS